MRAAAGVCPVTAGRPEGTAARFLDVTAAQARLVLSAQAETATYEVALGIMGVALTGMVASTPPDAWDPETLHEDLGWYPAGLYLIWAALTDEMDADTNALLDQAAVMCVRGAFHP